MLDILCQAHHVLMAVGRPMNKAEVAALCVCVRPPSLFLAPESLVQECLRELVRRGLATRKGARYTGTWNGLMPLPPGQVYAWRLSFCVGNGDRPGPVQPAVEQGFKSDARWLVWLSDQLAGRAINKAGNAGT